MIISYRFYTTFLLLYVLVVVTYRFTIQMGPCRCRQDSTAHHSTATHPSQPTRIGFFPLPTDCRPTEPSEWEWKQWERSPAVRRHEHPDWRRAQSQASSSRQSAA